MLRKVCLLVGLALIASVAARAQEAGDKIELFGGYAYMHFKSTPAANLNGFDLAGQYKVGDWFGIKLGVVADIGGEYGKVNGVSSHVYTYIFGPQISWPHRISPFVHALGGLGRFSEATLPARACLWDRRRRGLQGLQTVQLAHHSGRCPTHSLRRQRPAQRAHFDGYRLPFLISRARRHVLVRSQ